MNSGLNFRFFLTMIILASTSISQRLPQEKNPIIIGKARFTVVAPECIRMEYSNSGKFIDARSLFAVNREARFNDFKTSQDGNKTVIDTGKIVLTYNPDGKSFSKNNIQATMKKGKEIVEWHPGKQNTQNLGGTIRTLDGVKGPVDLGEGLLSRDGWYFLDDSKRHLFTDDWVVQRPKDSGTDWYLFGYGLDFKSALMAFTKIAGVVQMPRKYGLGAWYSRYWPYSSDDYRKIVKEYKDNNFPLDIMVLDMDWHKDGWTGWSWNRKLLPDAEELLKWFHKEDLFITLNLHPADGVGHHEDMYEAFMKGLGEDPSKRKKIEFDAGSKKYMDALFKYVHEPHESSGVDFWWLDWQQYPNTKSIKDLPNLAWLNYLYYRHTSRDNRRGMSFSRWGGWGDHRHPIHFSGDAHTEWPMLAFEVPFNSVAGNVGCFFWSHDIGGHMGPRNEETFARWVQFGATTAALRLHSTRSAELDRRPWTYSKQVLDSARTAFHLRSILFPYIYSSVWQCHTESVPLNRPMYINYPEDERAYSNAQQYLLGDHLLVAPVASPGAGPGKIAFQAVWFPEGSWYNWFTGEKHSIGEAVVAADINEFPIFARGGIPIPTQPYTQRMSTEPLKELVVRCYPGEDTKTGKYFLYEDDGVTQDYSKGEFALTELSYTRKGDDVTISITPSKGGYKGQVKSRSYVIELPCTLKADSAEIDGKSTKAEYDEKSFTNRIKVSSRPIGEGVAVRVQVKDADSAQVCSSALSKRMEGLLGKSPSGKPEDILSKHCKDLKDPAPETLFGLFGITVFKKNEGPYFYKGKENIHIYNNSNLVDGDKFTVKVIDITGDEKKELSSDEYKTGKNLPPVKISETAMSEPKLGTKSVRVVQLEFKIGAQPFSFRKIIAQKSSYIRKWNCVGPFDFDIKKSISQQEHEPENGNVDLSASYKGSGGKICRWKKAEIDDQYSVNLKQLFNSDNKLAYAVTFLHSEKEQQVTLKINTDDGVETFLNGKKIHSNHTFRPINHDSDLVRTTLKEGSNTLLLKVSQYSGGWAFSVAIESSSPIKESFTAE